MKKFIVTFLIIFTGLCFSAPVENAAFNDKAVRSASVKQLREEAEREKAEAVEWAKEHDINVRTVIDGKIIEIIKIDKNGRPIFFTTFNKNAAISTGANHVRETEPFNVDGSSITVGVWDGGVAYAKHREFNSPSRVTVKDGGYISDHPTHVAGTIGAAGLDSNAKGMAPKINIDAYDWNSDTSEMAARGASSPNAPGKIHLSNHSYGMRLGWAYYGPWYWFDDLSVTNEVMFGVYDYWSYKLDFIAYDAPYYLICISAGNDRNDNPKNGNKFYYYDSSSGKYIEETYNDNIHPLGDGVYKGGFDNLGPYACAKNVLTVGAVNDAVSGGARRPANGTMSTFSCWGPADDGRIKPDIVGNGINVYSPISNGYYSSSGTSMSSPNVCGSAALLVELYKNLHLGNAMRASSLKALLIHTADDLGNPGPDYSYGWGLINVEAAAEIIKSESIPGNTTKIYENQIADGSTIEIPYDIKVPQTFKTTLCWTDPSGTYSELNDDRNPKLVNDLDLKILSPDGKTNFPFVLDVYHPAAVATNADNSIDNVEQVIVENAPTGTYKIIISRKKGPENQFFSLITYISTPPTTPQNVSPANDEINISDSPELFSSIFYDQNIYDYLEESEWQICFDDAFTNIVWDDTSYSTNIYVASGYLNYSTQYFWRVRHQDNSNLWSEWSTPTSFSTVYIQPPFQPVNILPTNGEENLSVTPTLKATDFADTNINDNLTISRWQVSVTSDFSEVVWDANGSASSIAVASGNLHYSTQYFWRVKYRDKYGLWSEWSTPTYFKTANISYSDSAKITTAIVKKKKVLFKGTGLAFDKQLKGEPVTVILDDESLFNFVGDWKNSKKAAKVKVNDTDYKGIAKVITAGKKAGFFIIKAKGSQKKEPISGYHIIEIYFGDKFFTNGLNFVNGKYKEQ